MKHNFEDLTGRRFGRWTVLRLSNKVSGGNTYWFCQCECGNICEVQRGSLVFGGSMQCIDCGQRKIKYFRNIPLSYYNTIVKRAERRGLNIDITVADLDVLYTSQDRKCILSNLLIGFHVVPHGKYLSGWKHTASLDRIDSSVGYTIKNVQWLHQSINTMKNTYSQGDFIHFCKLVAKQFDNVIMPSETPLWDRSKRWDRSHE